MRGRHCYAGDALSVSVRDTHFLVKVRRERERGAFLGRVKVRRERGRGGECSHLRVPTTMARSERDR